MGKKEISKELSRREFLKDAAAGVGGLALAGLMGNEARAHEASTPGKWGRKWGQIFILELSSFFDFRRTAATS